MFDPEDLDAFINVPSVSLDYAQRLNRHVHLLVCAEDCADRRVVRCGCYTHGLRVRSSDSSSRNELHIDTSFGQCK